jgi:hypothetical protein
VVKGWEWVLEFRVPGTETLAWSLRYSAEFTQNPGLGGRKEFGCR